MDWTSIINGVVQAGGALGGKAIEGTYNKDIADIAAQGEIDQASILATARTGVAGWGAVGSGYVTPQQIAAEFGNKYKSAAEVEKAKVQAQAQKNQTVLIVAALGVAAVLVFVFFLASRKGG